MRSKLLSSMTVLGVVAVLLLAANTVSVAATGKGFVLGKVNSARTPTTLVRTTPGAALVVKSKSVANPPFAVNGRGRVTNLNADKVDGMDAVALRTGGQVFEIAPLASPLDAFVVTLPLAPGRYAVSYTTTFTSDLSGFTLCHLRQNLNGSEKFIAQDNHTGTGVATLSASGYAERTVNNTVTFHCQTGGTSLVWQAIQPIQITAIRLDGASPTQTLSPAPVF